MVSNTGKIRLVLTDFIPAVSGLIGKTALASSFALVWAQELGITFHDFVYLNVRLEIIIGSLIVLLAAILLPRIAPAGTLAPLIVLIPTMHAFGVHPFILGFLVGVLGMISVKTGIFLKLLHLPGQISKVSITIAFGISGIWLSFGKLSQFFTGKVACLTILLLSLTCLYVILWKIKKNWLIIPIAAVLAIVLPYFWHVGLDISTEITKVNLYPSYWWNDVWQIGFGLHIMTVIKTLPFALFVILLWTIDTVSIQTIQETVDVRDEEKIAIDYGRSFFIVSIRNLLGAFSGGAQTSSLWRSFLIPLFMVNRPMKICSIIMGILGVIAGVTGIPIKVMSYSPLVWSVLLFGIFVPFTVAGLQSLRKVEGWKSKSIVVAAGTLGIVISPVITWVVALLVERLPFFNYRKSQ